MIAPFHLATSFPPLHHAVVAQRGGGPPQALSSFILHTFPIWRFLPSSCFHFPAARNADVLVGSTEAEASFSGTAPALGCRRVRPAPERKWFHCKMRQQLKNHAFKIQLYSQAKDEHKCVCCKKAALACIFYECFSAFVLAKFPQKQKQTQIINKR